MLLQGKNRQLFSSRYVCIRIILKGKTGAAPLSFRHHFVEDIQEDEQGNIYLNTSRGLCKISGQKISLLKPVESNEWKLQPGDLWFKSLQFEGNVCRYDGKVLHSLQLPPFQPGEDWRSKYPNSPSPYAVYTIYKDSKKNIWFGTAALGPCRYNGQTFDWIFEEDVTELHHNPSMGIRSMTEDREGYFWFNSAYRYRVYGENMPAGKTFYSRERSIGSLDGLPDSLQV
jgi:ligand-binding sensor domain-containing protein